MELIVRHDGRETVVRVERAQDAWSVSLDGRTYRVDSVPARRALRSLIIDGRQSEVSLHKTDGNCFEVSTAHGVERIEVLEPLMLLAEKSHGGAEVSATSRISAYMPGRVVQLLVGEGDPVSAGQGVVVLEAMKMENEIQAERNGVVSRFFVAPGQAVEGGDPLYELRSER